MVEYFTSQGITLSSFTGMFIGIGVVTVWFIWDVQRGSK